MPTLRDIRDSVIVHTETGSHPSDSTSRWADKCGFLNRNLAWKLRGILVGDAAARGFSYALQVANRGHLLQWNEVKVGFQS